VSDISPEVPVTSRPLGKGDHLFGGDEPSVAPSCAVLALADGANFCVGPNVPAERDPRGVLGREKATGAHHAAPRRQPSSSAASMTTDAKSSHRSAAAMIASTSGSPGGHLARWRLGNPPRGSRRGVEGAPRP
jgi:hypothetical protein